MAETNEVPLFHQLHRASQMADDLFCLLLNNQHLTPRQYILLAAVADQPGLNQASLTEVTGVDRSTMTDITRRLTSVGLLERQRNLRDTRAINVTITPLGMELLNSLKDVVCQVDKVLLGRLEASDRLAFKMLLAAFLKNGAPTPIGDQ